jgi:7-carboxy-7-deazaguanine synthase
MNGLPHRSLLMAEVFGPTIQGEGPSAGQRAVFARLSARYDLDAERAPVTPTELLATLTAADARLVVITGGEPLLQQEALLPVIAGLAVADGADYRVEVETSGTIAPRPELLELVTIFNVSPKLAHSGLTPSQRRRPDALRALAASGKAVWKFVVRGAGDFAELAQLVDEFKLSPVWVMPEGTTSLAVTEGFRAIAEPAIERGWNVSPRLHVLVWENDRGH